MGNTAAAVLHYDHANEIKKQSPRMWEAMRDFTGKQGMLANGWFGFGEVVSCDHSSGFQIVAVQGNTGWRIGRSDQPPPDDVLMWVAAALRAHGWKVQKPKS